MSHGRASNSLITYCTIITCPYVFALVANTISKCSGKLHYPVLPGILFMGNQLILTFRGKVESGDVFVGETPRAFILPK